MRSLELWAIFLINLAILVAGLFFDMPVIFKVFLALQSSGNILLMAYHFYKTNAKGV